MILLEQIKFYFATKKAQHTSLTKYFGTVQFYTKI